MATVNDLAKMSADVYSAPGTMSPPSGWSVLPVNNNSSTFDPSTGLYATAYGRIDANGALAEVVVAYRGMDPTDTTGDVASVSQLYAGEKPAQYDPAAAFYQAVRNEYGSEAPISLTGHSLGGALASMVGAFYGNNATVFNAVPTMGALEAIGLDPLGDYSNITNHNAVFDPASSVPLTYQIGNVFDVFVSSIGNIPDWLEPLVSFLGAGLVGLGAFLYDQHSITNLVNINFLSARNFIQRRDPLTLDLDSDGLETVGIDPNNPILFDHNGDGIKNATGWIRPDDGFLVLDRNSNGSIDNGSELFGDSTPLAAGGNATDGFAALAQEDTNSDGLVNNLDANWNNLRVWQDANSDGLSQEDELKTLDALNIAGFHVAKTENNTNLTNGNQIADLGTYIKTDGTEGTVGAVNGALADINLADNPFYREFTDTIPLTEQAQTLPNLQGSGALRDLREAMSLSPALTTAVSDYAAANTRAAQMAQIDGVINQWAASSGFQTSLERAEGQGYHLIYLVPGQTPLDTVSWGSGGTGALLSPDELARRVALQAEQARVNALIATLERFNGMTFVNIEPQGIRTGADLFVAAVDDTSSGGFGGNKVILSLTAAQIDMLDRSYSAVRQSVYEGLLTQTRLKPYVDAIGRTSVRRRARVIEGRARRATTAVRRFIRTRHFSAYTSNLVLARFAA